MDGGKETLFTIKNYVVAESLEQAYELNQKKNNVILGGIGWLKMGGRNIQTAIDLSTLGLDKIEEDEECFKIGCMCTLRQLETHESLNSYFDGIIAKSVIHIVGVQFRNCATIGGSVYSRFGFSDILTALLSLDTHVELFNKGIIPLSEYRDMTYDNDILVRIIIKKDNRRTTYLTHRNSATDIPTLAVAVSRLQGKWNIVIGARPQKAMTVNAAELLSEIPTQKEIDEVVEYVMQNVKFDSNMRGSKEYRQILTKVFINRAVSEITGGSYGN